MNKILVPIGLFVGAVFSGCVTADVAQKDIKSGMFSYMADSAMFMDCSTKERFPVAFEDDYISLERAYLETIQEAGKDIKVNLNGKIVLRDGMDGKVNVPTLVVKKFISITPKQRCQN